MRFLCLHGMGTNSKIFELQTASIRHALGSGHEFVFVDGTIPWNPAPGIKAIFPEEEEFLRYIIEEDTLAFNRFYENVKAFAVAYGPFDGICGFSEGGGLAASLVAAQFRHPDSMVMFKCAVFFSAGPAIDLLALEEGKITRLDFVTHGTSLRIPTVHIWDPEDSVHPGFGGAIQALCDSETMEEVKHHLGHEIPGKSSSHAVAECSRAINRTIERASIC